jgi:hypothetical protein
VAPEGSNFLLKKFSETTADKTSSVEKKYKFLTNDFKDNLPNLKIGNVFCFEKKYFKEGKFVMSQISILNKDHV